MANLNKGFVGAGWYDVYTNADVERGDPNYVWEEDGRLLAGNYNAQTGTKEVRFDVPSSYRIVPR